MLWIFDIGWRSFFWCGFICFTSRSLRKTGAASRLDSIDKQVKSIRADLNHFVLPRHIEPDNIKVISDYLQKFPPHTATICVDYTDSEASAYANDIDSALYNGGWTVLMRGSADDQIEQLRERVDSAPKAPVTFVEFWNIWINWIQRRSKNEGLTFDIERSSRLRDEINKRTRPDLKNPDSDKLLTDALASVMSHKLQ